MHKSGKAIKRFMTKNGKEVLLRYPKMGDVDGLLELINSLVSEPGIKIGRTKMATRKEESEWLEKNIEKIKKGELKMMAAETGGKIIGSAEMRIGRDVNLHVADFGISLSKAYRNVGIGTEMMNTLFEEAKKLGTKIIMLKAFSDNTHALRVYRKMGFKTFGRLPRGIYKNKRYIDEIYMYKNL